MILDLYSGDGLMRNSTSLEITSLSLITVSLERIWYSWMNHSGACRLVRNLISME